jgi:group I intron endonuclease
MVIYKTTNLINNKIYVGQDSHNNPAYLGSGKILNNAIKKYGKDNFKKEILEECSSKKELNEREIYWINKLNSTDTNVGYNIATGGHGGNLGELVNKKIASTIRQLYNDPNSVYNSTEYKNRLSKGQEGRIVTEVTRKKISEAQKGEKAYWYGKKNDLHSTKMREKYATGELTPWNKGMKYDDSTKKKFSEAHQGQIPWNKGKKDIYSEKTKELMSAAKRGIPRADISEKLKIYYSKNLSVQCKSIIDTRTGKVYDKIIALREELGLTEYMYKKLLTKGILIWNDKK